MNALAWCAFIILYLFFLFNKRRNQWRLQQFLKSITDEQLRYSVHIADEKVTIISNGNTYEFAWVEYNSFGIHQDTLYIFNEVNRMNTLYWNQNEMGGEAFLALRKLLEQKGIKQAF